MILVPLEAKKARAKALKKVFNVLSTVDKTLEESFREFMPHLNPIERKRMIALIQEVDSFKFECKGRMVSLKEKIEAEEE